MAMAGWSGIELTTIVQPLNSIVDAAVALIESGIADPDAVPDDRLLPFSLADRNTLRQPD